MFHAMWKQARGEQQCYAPYLVEMSGWGDDFVMLGPFHTLFRQMSMKEKQNHTREERCQLSHKAI